MVSRDDSGRSAASSKEQSRKSVELAGSQKITMFFQKKQEEKSLPLAPRQQRAIPKVRQAEPRPILHSSSQEDPGTKPLAKKGGALSTAELGTTDERHSADAEVAAKTAMTRDDAVDVKLQAQVKEMTDDVVTNPVVQANKRALRNEKDVTFLASHSKNKTVSFQDEQIKLLEEQGARGEANVADFEHEIEIERASDDEDEGTKTRSRLRKNRRQVDSDYNENQEAAAAQEDSGEDAPMDDLEAETILDELPKKKTGKPEKKHSRRHRTEVDEAQLGGEEQEETVFIDNLPNEEAGIRSMLIQVRRAIVEMEKTFLMEEDSDPEEDARQLTAMKVKHNPGAGFDSDGEQEIAPNYINDEKQFHCIPLSANVTEYDWATLGEQQLKHGGKLFDIITMDPPWQLSSANPTRGVAIAYDTLVDDKIMDIPFHLLQSDGFLFIWVINAKYRFALNLFKKHKYKLVDEIVWVKQTINGKINKGHGYYLQHAKETCLIGYKGDLGDRHKINVDSDVIFSMRRGQSQKPEEIYEIAESLVPNGYYMEIFGRRNNLHDGWVTIGNEL